MCIGIHGDGDDGGAGDDGGGDRADSALSTCQVLIYLLCLGVTSFNSGKNPVSLLLLIIFIL